MMIIGMIMFYIVIVLIWLVMCELLKFVIVVSMSRKIVYRFVCSGDSVVLNSMVL